MQIFIPQGSDDTIETLLEGHEVLGRWRDTDADQVVLYLLVPAEETEPIMDRFEQQFETTIGFHVILFSVEAVLPRPEPDKELQSEESEEIKYGRQRISREELYGVVTDGLDISRVFL